MSLIHTAELCGVAPFEYLTAVLRHQEAAASAPESWMPWNVETTLAAEAAARH